MKLLTFLGINNYRRVTYRWGERSFETELFPEAVFNWLQPTSALVFLTAEAEQHANWATLRGRLPEGRVRPVRIPSGRDEGELWQVFQALADNIEPGDEVVCDATNAFRSLPVLTLLAIQYVKVVRDVKLGHLLYGAFEAASAGVAPVFDLSPFLGLLDWLTAARTFRDTGDAGGLAELLQEAHSLPWRAPGASQGELPRYLRKLGDCLEGLSEALALVRTNDVRKVASRLPAHLNRVREESDRWARPFSLLLDHTAATYAPLAGDDPLPVERHLVGWYIEHGHIVQAVTLAREWLISWACHATGQDRLNGRHDVENAITENWVARYKGGAAGTAPLTTALIGLPEYAVLLETWNVVGDLRNDLAHCGMRPNARSAATVRAAALELLGRLKQFPI